MGGIQSGGDKFMPFARGVQYIIISSPTVLNINNWEIPKTALDFICSNLTSKYHNGVAVKWGFLSPGREGWKEVASLVTQGKVNKTKKTKLIQ